MWSLSATDRGTIAPTVGASTTYTPPATGTAGVVTLTATGNGKSATATISLTAAATPPAMDSEFNITLRYLDDNLSAAKSALRELIKDQELSFNLSKQALTDSRKYSWEARGKRINKFINERVQQSSK